MTGKKIEQNNVTITLNVLYAKKQRLDPPNISKNNSNREKQVILLMVSNGEGRWLYLVVKKTICIIERSNF